jgi:hypothetical protein
VRRDDHPHGIDDRNAEEEEDGEIGSRHGGRLDL